MKNLRKIFVVAIIGLILVSGNAYAGGFVKLGRGLTNIISSPGEIIYQPIVLQQTNNVWVSWLGGVPKGIIFFPVRLVVGIYDVITCPIPYPKQYAPVVLPETLFEGFKAVNSI